MRWNPGLSAPGDYIVTAHVDDGRGRTANCTAAVRVEPRPNRPPTITCAASPTTIRAGEVATIVAIADDPDNDPLTYNWSVNGGRVVGSGPQVQFDTTGFPPGRYTASGQVSDGHGGTADCRVELDVQLVTLSPETRLSLHSIYFPIAPPTVTKPNDALLASQERTLLALANDFKQYRTLRPEAHLILQGHAYPLGSQAYSQALSERYVGRTMSFLVEHGVPADHIDIQGLGKEQPWSADLMRQVVEQDQTLTPAQKRHFIQNPQILAKLAIAQSNRVDFILSTTGQTSVRQFPFNAEDVLDLVRGTLASSLLDGISVPPSTPTPTPTPTPPPLTACSGLVIFIAPHTIDLTPIQRPQSPFAAAFGRTPHDLVDVARNLDICSSVPECERSLEQWVLEATTVDRGAKRCACLADRQPGSICVDEGNAQGAGA